MEISTQSAKRELRAKVQAHLRQLAPPEREAAAAQARALLREQPVWKQARSVLLFAPLPDELDVWPLLAAALAGGRTVALPRFDPQTNSYVACQVQNLVSDVKTGRFGIREPAEHCAEIPLNRLDFILVPGVAFDMQGRRLGRGKGFFDRLLAAARGTTSGVVFDEQIVREIPVAAHDVRVNRILTPTRWIEARPVLE
jgi:5-formyltetrahydrofolate cyclo-ligase